MPHDHSKMVECIIPVLSVRDVHASKRFYTETLGFRLDWGADDPTSLICSVSRDGMSLMLSALTPFVAPGRVWIGLEDDSLFSEYTAKGVPVIQAPKNFSWAYEMKFADPDGNILWLGTAAKPDLPLEDAP